jgi:hypothetical protein
LRIIVLRKGQVVKVDDEDFDKLTKFVWGIISNKSGHTYAARGTRKNGVYRKILMHREIMNNPSGMVDHINGDTLDNQKSNLRIVTRQQNLQNSKRRSDCKSRYKGVSKRGAKFIARIQINPKQRIFLGYFETEIEAALAYDKAALQYFGEYAKINH